MEIFKFRHKLEHVYLNKAQKQYLRQFNITHVNDIHITTQPGLNQYIDIICHYIDDIDDIYFVIIFQELLRAIDTKKQFELKLFSLTELILFYNEFAEEPYDILFDDESNNYYGAYYGHIVVVDDIKSFIHFIQQWNESTNSHENNHTLNYMTALVITLILKAYWQNDTYKITFRQLCNIYNHLSDRVGAGVFGLHHSRSSHVNTYFTIAPIPPETTKTT
jgi:hypothetical protein